MLNLNELEGRWLHYKLKFYIPHILILISLITILLITSSLYFTTNDKPKTIAIKESYATTTKKPELTQKISTSIVEKEIPRNITKKTPIFLNDVNKKIKLTPSMNFIKSIKSDVPVYYNEEPKVKLSKPIKKETKIIQEPEIIVQAPKIEIVQDSMINIKRQETNDDIQHVITRFKKSNNPALSLFIAKKYYEVKDYNQAYNYSLITNEINNNIEDGWIIFAKSLVKLNKKDKAIAILKKYIHHSNSQKAKLLLDNIKSGKMK